MKYQVLENGRPVFHPASLKWNKWEFESESEARAYLDYWLGRFSIPHDLPLNTPYDYNGLGDKVMIRTES